MGHEAMCPPPSKQGLYYSRKLQLQLLKHPRSNIRTASDSSACSRHDQHVNSRLFPRTH